MPLWHKDSFWPKAREKKQTQEVLSVLPPPHTQGMNFPGESVPLLPHQEEGPVLASEGRDGTGMALHTHSISELTLTCPPFPRTSLVSSSAICPS